MCIRKVLMYQLGYVNIWWIIPTSDMSLNRTAANKVVRSFHDFDITWMIFYILSVIFGNYACIRKVLMYHLHYVNIVIYTDSSFLFTLVYSDCRGPIQIDRIHAHVLSKINFPFFIDLISNITILFHHW